MAHRTTAAGSSGGQYLDYVAGVQEGTLLVALDRKMPQEEICHVVEGVGQSLDVNDFYQLEKAIIARSHLVGQIIETEFKLTPVIWSAAKSTTNPSNPDYLPVIARTVDVDVTFAQAPDLVTKLRDEAAAPLGVSSWAATVSGSVITLPNTTAAIALVTQIQEDAFVQRFLTSGQSPTYAASGVDFTNGRCINVAGTDYAITAVSVGSRTVTVSGSPASGTQTVIFYPYRIAGSSTSIRLHRLTGFVGVAQGDSDAQYIGGLRMMDRGHGHKHVTIFGTGAVFNPSNGQYSPFSAKDSPTVTAAPMAEAMTTDGTNGTPRTGKTTDPRGHARFVYTWAGRLIA